MCVFDKHETTITLHGAKEAPPAGGLRPLLAKAKELGADTVCWLRSEEDGLRLVKFSI
jgi:hypothetical protein